MYAQVVQVRLVPGGAERFDALVEQWKASCGLRIAGASRVTWCHETDGLGRALVLVEFDDAESLREFSDDPDSLDIFEEAKDLFQGKVQFFEAEKHTANLQ